ncbi:uncharacterized protein LOC121385106 [Gigantopelta aegis]|uniref:uncharacterized protein LOC121385106 n=1 Tax=Gigantopelta aegis TaxID=1735272 RepID=UPI001B88E27F|nr:uncharacterized protein LOC121385106 [Gigantopelta aegis]
MDPNHASANRVPVSNSHSPYHPVRIYGIRARRPANPDARTSTSTSPVVQTKPAMDSTSDGRTAVYRRQGERYVTPCVLEGGRFGDGGVIIWGGIAATGRTQMVVIEDGLDTLHGVTWDTAIRTCRERGGKLYNTTDTSALGDVTPGSYWIGGKVQYSSWVWTADKKSLFEYAGELNESYSTYSRVYTILYDNQTILYDNQASRCYYECRQQNNRKPVYVGLQESMCYCFGSLNPGSITTDNRTHRGCLGNFMECCGTDRTISIYRPD